MLISVSAFTGTSVTRDSGTSLSGMPGRGQTLPGAIVDSTEAITLSLARASTHPGIFSSGSEKGADLLRFAVLTGNPVRMVDMAGLVSRPLLRMLSQTSCTPTYCL